MKCFQQADSFEVLSTRHSRNAAALPKTELRSLRKGGTRTAGEIARREVRGNLAEALAFDASD
jgi:hypothetical protein